MVTLNQLSRGVGQEGGWAGKRVQGAWAGDWMVVLGPGQPLCSSRGPLEPGVNLKVQAGSQIPPRWGDPGGAGAPGSPRVLFLMPQRALASPHSVLEQGRGLGTPIIQPEASTL